MATTKGPKQGMDQRGDVATVTRPRDKLERPRLYKVLFHNDDYTPREFVVLVLEHIFGMGEAEAQATMLHVHNHGVGVAGVYTFAIAETKVAQVAAAADRAGHPLLVTMEPEDGYAPED
jgi:ATP-dependent Clp protease adaptor protein ClpS